MANESEQEKRETLADIVAEMRTRSREVKEAFGGRPDGVENMLDIWAKRIEAIDSADAWRSLYTPGNAAAHDEVVLRLSKEEYKGMQEALLEHDRLCEMLSESRKSIGNAAAMRDALKTILDLVNSLDEECGVDPVEIRDIARVALSKPARNCDIMSRSICTKHFSTIYEGNRDGLCDVQTEREKNIHLYYIKFNKWLFATAERKGDGDGR